MHGDVTAALRWFLKFKKIVTKHFSKKKRLRQCWTDPCVFYRMDKYGKLELIAVAHADDDLLAGKKKKTDEFLDEFEKHLNIARAGAIDQHLGVTCECRIDKHGQHLKASMPDHVDVAIDAHEKLAGCELANV